MKWWEWLTIAGAVGVGVYLVSAIQMRAWLNTADKFLVKKITEYLKQKDQEK